MKKILFRLFLIALPILSGCGKGDSGAKLVVTTDTPLAAPSAKPALPIPALSKPFLAATGDGPGDTFPDQVITPSAVTVGLKSFRFFKKNETATPGQTQESYTVLDTDPTAPRVIAFQTGVPEEVIETVSDPDEGTYDRVEYEITFVEMVIPLCREDNRCEDRRLRYYLTAVTDPEIGLATTPRDLLISRTENGLDFAWISSALGLPGSLDQFPITGTRPGGNDTPLQITLSSSSSTQSVFSLQLPTPLEIPRKPKVRYVFTLHFDLAGLFFYDNTDEATIDSAPPFHFNALVSNINASQDGRIRIASCPLPSAPCITTADFAAALPVVSVTMAEEETD